MTHTQKQWICCLLVVALVLMSSSSLADTGTDFFESKIRPVLAQRCYTCHSAEAQQKGKLKGELLLDTRSGIRKGGESGPAVVPGNVDESILVAAIRHESFEMPPKAKLADNVIADFVKWIEMGAPDPRDGSAIVKKEEIDIEAGRQFWSFRPLQRVFVPKVRNADWPNSEIDTFILQRLEDSDLQPVGDADARTLIRRLYFDLIGLPPSPAEIDAFVAAAASDRDAAIESLVDRMLESSHFGERWGRHWLDVARYAENNGAPKQNAPWPDAIKYRQYVIDAINDDLPVDQFVRQQIAGDLLPADSDAQRRQQIVATGLLALGMKPDAGTRMEVIAEQTDVIGRGFLGIAIGCARCHDHKFDPVPTRDFYALAGILINSEPKDQNSGVSRSRYLTADLAKSDVKQYQDYLRGLTAHNATINKSHARIVEILAKKGLRFDPLKGYEENVAALDGNDRNKAEQALTDLRKAEAELEKLHAAGIPDVPLSIAVEETGVKGKFVNTQIQIRGNEDNLGEEVPRGGLQVLCAESLQIANGESGRLQLADLIATHPLTYRVMANRVWHHLFGRGIVRSVDNFGTLGDPPTQPELLEWLTGRLYEHRSLKQLVREIVLSRTYQLSSAESSTAMKFDPDNALLWRHSPRRRDAESLRDAILSAAGTLERTAPDRWQQLSYHTTSQNLDAMSRARHRAVYLPVIRGRLPDLFAAFNFPPPDLVIGRRETPSVPTQALFLMNSPLVMEQSQFMARRILDDDGAKMSNEQRIGLACQLAFGRGATTSETSDALTLISNWKTEVETERSTLDAWAAFCQSLFCSAEFRFVE